MGLGEIVERERANAGLSRAKLAERAGVSVTTIEHVERRKHEPKPRILRALAAALEIEPARLFEAVS